MIVRTERSYLARAFDFLLTALAWAGFTYLAAEGVLKLVEDRLSGSRWDLWSPLLATLDTLLVYVLVAVFNALVLLVWARYDQKRFGGRARRYIATESGSNSLIEHFTISPETFRRLQTGNRVVIRHDDDGLIIDVDSISTRI